MPANRAQTIGFTTLVLALPTLVTWLYFVALKGTPASLQQTAYALGKAVQFGLPLVWVLAVHRDVGRLGIPSARGLGIGVAFGLVIAVAMGVLYHFVLRPAGFFDGPAREVIAKVTSLGLNSRARYLSVAVFYAVCHAFLEEYYWRWFVFRELRTIGSLPTAIVLSSLGFMAHHVLMLAAYFGWSSPATWLFSAAVAIGGAMWAWLYDRSRSLLGPGISHCLVDAAIFWIGYDLVRGILQ